MRTPAFKISRRRFLGGVSLAAVGTFSYAHFFEAEWLQKSFITVPLSGGTKPPVKLLHISDLHASAVVSLGYIRKAIDAGLAWKPDLICVTGDFITRKFEKGGEYLRVLDRLRTTAPTFASLGNHDGGRWAIEDEGYGDIDWIAALLEKSGIKLLHNDSTHACIAGRDLKLVGLGDIWAGNLDVQRGFAQRASGIPRGAALHEKWDAGNVATSTSQNPLGTSETILLSHNPDTKDHVDVFQWDLMLCGHTHGGQLRVPWLGATPFAPVQDKRFVAGLHRWNERWIHITKGIGSVFGMRINCPPEVSFLTLT